MEVLATESALQWEFPGHAVEIPLDEFLGESFCEHLAAFLEQASSESLPRFRASSAKAKVSVIEARDTTDPALITQFLLPLLEAVGSSIEVPILRKRVRDDVNIENAELPWRRLPFWLILRVSIHRQLLFFLGNESGRACYKFLICTVLAQLLEDCADQMDPELTLLLRAKLCRRLAKLETDKSPASSSIVYNHLFESVGPMLKEIIEEATYQVKSAWAKFKSSIARTIPRLPLRADEQSLHLSLPNSGKYFTNLMATSLSQKRGAASLHLAPSGNGTIEQVTEFTSKYFTLARWERSIETERKPLPESVIDCQARCAHLAKSIVDAFTVVGNAYDANPEQMSIFILNLFDLWVQMDQSVVRACPLLLDYAPVFTAELLDVLQLPTLLDMERLQNIQGYLQSRYKGSRFEQKTIFSEPDRTSFAARYVEQSVHLCKLQQKIEEASDRSRRIKQSEWERSCIEYDKLSEKISSGTCVCSNNPDGSRNVKGCKKCWNWRCRRRMNITIHEDFLPQNEAQKAAVVLELGMPNFLAAYRNATFKILTDLGYPSKPKPRPPPVMLLSDYSQLKKYMNSTVDGVSLASAKKSFLQTHFKAFKMKVNVSDIILPLGLDFAYYDAPSGTWLKGLDKPLTFQHLCGVHVPQSLHSTVISLIHPPQNTDGPSSYEIVASQTKCPTEISVHEFMAYQRLLSGKTRRWLSMLVELGASNLNFSAEDTMLLYNHLSIQAGTSQNDNVLRDSHIVFQDPLFCERLTKQIELRLRNINTNWREMHCMELLITLSLRLFHLTSGPDRQSAERLLKMARQSTLQWISCLRDEVRNATEADAAERAARYGFWSALLCRRTFTIFVDSNLKMSAEDISSFVQASVALQENLVVDLAKLPAKLKNMLVRDTKMAYRVGLLLEQSIKEHPDSLGVAINNSWSDSENSTKRTYSRWQFLPSPNERWVVSVITTTANRFVVSQVIHYNFIEGHLMVDGKPLGRLPLNIRESEDVKELFGNQHLLTFPSSMTGMSHVMATRASHGNQVHFGLRGTTVVIRALQYNSLLEYVPRSVFVDKDVFDLPLGLIENCVHWLNLETGHLEIRRKPYIWKTRLSDWKIDIFRRRAQRKRVFLVDPHSSLFKSVAGIFRHFEDSNRLTVYQPMSGTLSIEMRRLELSFFVNKSNLVECRELHAEIDPNQDAGTLYGFLSKIVLRDVANPKLRSIITPIGPLFYKRNGMHVVVQSSSSTVYGKFGIDDILGRLSCPPEPLLLYSKAQFHALTSFVLPDPLTGRTGTEEALHTLRSGYCQPWRPLNDRLESVLKVISNLSPSREYYPKDLRRLQTVTWDIHLTMNIQHDSYEEIVNEIVAKSNRIRAFVTTDEKEAPCSDIETPLHLRRRGNFQRLLYERESSDSVEMITAKDMVYNSRDRQASLPQATKVYQTVQLLRKQPFHTHVEKKLVTILQKWNLIGGFHNYKPDSKIVPMSLGDLMEDDIGEQWGSLVNLCRNTSSQDPYKLIFRLALLSFGTKPNMDVIQLLASFARVEELRDLQPPGGSFFADFKLFEVPTLELLLKFIEIDLPDAEVDVKKTRKAQERHEKHRILYSAEGSRLASFLLKQWPSSELSARGLEPLRAINVGVAFERIIPEWQRLYRNFKLSEYVMQAQEILDCYNGPKNQLGLPPRSKISPVLNMRHLAPPIPALSDLLANATIFHFDRFVPNDGTVSDNGQPRGFDFFHKLNTILFKNILSKEVIELEKILASFAKSPEVLRQQYGNDLKMSLLALKNISTQSQLQVTPPDAESIKESVSLARKALDQFFHNIRIFLSGSYERYKWLDLGGLWPCITPITLLEQLRSSSNHRFGNNMKEALVSFGVLITTLQRLVRINHASLKGDHNKQLQEWQNKGHENWKPLEFPDWLLLEIESDLLIRSEQIDVAHAIISPASGSNSVLQLNMGKGKHIDLGASVIEAAQFKILRTTGLDRSEAKILTIF